MKRMTDNEKVSQFLGRIRTVSSYLIKGDLNLRDVNDSRMKIRVEIRERAS